MHPLKHFVPAKWRSNLRRYLVGREVRHLFGPKTIRLASNEAAVTCVVKNGEFYLEAFVEHYSRMGFRHIFLLDNESTDGTVSLGKQYDNVSIYQSGRPVGTDQGLLKSFLAENCIIGGWCLDADIDEFFDYPFSEVVGLRRFLEYLNSKHFDAVTTQLLDMFSDKPLSHLADKQGDNFKVVYRYYDISAVDKVDYQQSEMTRHYGQKNTPTSESASLYFGGIRKTLYGNNCLLTKHSLFRPGRNLDLFPHVHFVNNAILADVSCVLLHYKLTSNAYETATQNKDAFVAISKGYRDLIEVLESNADLRIKQSTASELRSVSELIENKFLFVSDHYRDFVADSQGRGSHLSTRVKI